MGDEHDSSLVMSAYEGTARITYSVSGRTAVQERVGADAPFILPLEGDDGLLSDYRSLEARGVVVTSDAPLFVTIRGMGDERSSATIRESAVALGTEFRAAGYSLNNQEVRDGGLFGSDEVREEGADMLVVFAPTGAVVQFEAPVGTAGDFWDGITGVTHQVTIPAGQAYSIRTRGDVCGAELDGATVRSDQPVAVLSGGRGEAGICGVEGSCEDEGLDNILPISQWGTEFAVFNFGSAGTEGENVRVVADRDGTEVVANGRLQTTLDAGQTFEFIPDAEVTRIRTSAPAGVFQTAGESSCNLGYAFVPPLDLDDATTDLHLAFDVPVQEGDAVVLTTRAHVDSLTLDGVRVQADEHAVSGRDDLVALSFEVVNGEHVLNATGDFHVYLALGASGRGFFGAYSPYRTVSTSANCTDDSMCEENQTCVGGVCVTTPGGCVRDADCAADEVCTDEGSCAPTCDSDADCALPELCLASICVPPCGTDADCTAGDECTASGECQTPCDDDSVCQGTLTCSSEDTCVECDDDSACLSGFFCNLAGACEPECTSNDDCGGVTPVCAADGRCVECLSDSFCSSGERCDDRSVCVPTCSADSDCSFPAAVCDTRREEPTCVECLSDAGCQGGRCSDVNTCVGGAPTGPNPGGPMQPTGERPTFAGNTGCSATPMTQPMPAPVLFALFALSVASLTRRKS